MMKRTKKKGSTARRSTSQSTFEPLRMVRVGHPARIQRDIQPYSLDALVQNAHGTEIVREVRQELQTHITALQQSSSSNGPQKRDKHYVNRRLIYQEMKTLRKEIRVREERVVHELIDHAHVVFTTCTGAATLVKMSSAHRGPRNQPPFDLVIIDEAAQSIEAVCWIPVLLASRKVVLAGDHLQLPPTITTHNPTIQAALQRTMFERLMELYHPPHHKNHNGDLQHSISRMLKVQYRMNERIANWASQALYHNVLQTHASVQHHTLIDLDGTIDTNDADYRTDLDILHTPLLFIDTADCDLHESTNASGSRYNPGEAQVVRTHVQHLLSVGVTPEQIAVITPYNGQVELLKSILLPEVASTLQIRSVDGFQGGEREAVIISLVRSSPKGGIDGIGFLSDKRRLNVAITRAKRHCCVIGDSETVRQSPLIRNFMEWVEQYGEQRSALEIVSDHSPNASDLVEAERMMQQLMDGTADTKTSAQRRDKPSFNTSDPAQVEIRRKMLFDKVHTFVSQKKAGDEMILASELTKLDRKLVHEVAEELGLEHKSDGVDGVNRRITIRIPNNSATLPIPDPIQETPTSDNSMANDLNVTFVPENGADTVDHALEDDIKAVATPFTELESNDDDDDDDTDDIHLLTTDDDDVTEQQPVGLNNVLGSLAKERAEREKQRQQTQSSDKKKKNKGNKLGGARTVPLQTTHPASFPATATTAASADDDDDMAFLDAQIDAVQNSHGRNVIGSGKAYRSIINGVLIAKPVSKQPVPTSKNIKTSALNAKIKAAQESRKTQAKKK